MKYNQSRSHKKTKGRTFPWWIILGALVVIIISLLFLLLSGKDDSGAIDDDEEVVEINDVGEEGTVAVEQMIVTDVSDASFEQIPLKDSEGRGYTGIARRGIEKDLYTHVVVAELPAIDTERYFYEGWLVQPGVLTFFSTGEMFVREDGKWGLVWEVQERDQEVEVADFTRAVITLEPRDGDPAPAADHVLEGDFEIEVEFSGLLPF